MNLHLTKRLVINKDLIEAGDLTDRFTQDDLGRVGNLCIEGYQRDKASRSKWERRMKAALDLAMQVQRAKTFPWPGASNVVFPLVTIGALEFSANAYTNLFEGDDIIKYGVVGPDKDGKLFQRAERIGRHMSWQCLEQDTEWEDEHDRLLIYQAIVGCAFTKTYFSNTKVCPISSFVAAQNLVVNYWAKSLESCPRKTEIIAKSRNDIYEAIMDKTFRDVRGEAWYNSTPPTITEMPTLGEDNRRGQQPEQSDETTPFQVLEQHRSLDLDGDGYEEPYVITLEQSSRKVLRIVARFETSGVSRKADSATGEIQRIRAVEYFTKYPFIPSPDRGFYESGFGIFLGPLNEAVNSGINQLLDAGTVQNSNGGFLGRGVKMRGGAYTIAPFEWKRIDSMGDDIRKNMVPFPKSEPSQTTLALIELLVEYANKISGATATVTGENPGQNTPASTYQGMVERGLQIYKMIFKRDWRAAKEEAKKRYECNKQYLPVEQPFGPGEDFIRAEDYRGDSNLVRPVADPDMPSTVLRIQQAVTLKTAAAQTPGYDRDFVEKKFLKALNIPDVDQCFPGSKTTGPLPNEKVQIEQMKSEVAMMKQKLGQMNLVHQMAQDRKINEAKIHLLEAQAAKLVKEAGNVGAAENLKAFEMAMDALKGYSEQLTKRIDSMSKEGDGSGEKEGKGSADQGGVPGLAPTSGNGGVAPGNGALAPGANGAMGGQGIPA